ncbi:restriction endonuclease subunit S [Lactiplantibacillus plantarum]|uniref:restriction endonuclease subunit S n=1 Tax=Lactiplantibacillus plantarum TaxID=1590 RepID=UPI0006966589|nr:restriction endonuclease subunit S [Lactiplantibacillus plantarum]MCG0571912.1 restriction endonuclease subunit S [Lactiplantibacillus plantarum]MCG0675117.1 restriction endonuclease subunit S [Lactiplantibacillus plantarum]MCG0781552.1 restriction endonuclease subunit S [Lactiplantibacillus plantarum]MCG0809589.1 restriction endonuclease subunit S [Lactiplantibacillus plantarum]MCG0861323.1 restriction endonuclease subunit S [Lactiplantibacillus plantarum]
MIAVISPNLRCSQVFRFIYHILGTGTWEQRKLGDYGNIAMNRRIFKEETSTEGDIPFYKIGTFGKNPDAFISQKRFIEYKSKYPYPKKGDILISASGSIGRTIEYQGENAYYQDSNIVWLNHDERLVNSFLKQFYLIVRWSGLEGSTIKRLYNKNILKTNICVPLVDEQNKIGNFLSKLDSLIAANEQVPKLVIKIVKNSHVNLLLFN